MNSRLPTFVIISIILLHQTLFAQKPSGIAVVELFTSEGCSSCPAAEDVLMNIAGENNKNIYILEFHVDYWDRLGWKDPYSEILYSNRQKAYGQLLAVPNIYTPQVIVNGSTELIGSDEIRLQKVIGEELLKSQSPVIAIQAKIVGQNAVNISYKIDSGAEDVLSIALIQLETSSDVNSGENKGRNLHHIQVVRTFKTIKHPGGSGDITLSLPNGVVSGNTRVLAYLQNKNDWHVKGAAQSEPF